MNTRAAKATPYPSPALHDLANAIRGFFKSPDNLAEFEAWRAERNQSAVERETQQKKGGITCA